MEGGRGCNAVGTEGFLTLARFHLIMVDRTSWSMHSACALKTSAAGVGLGLGELYSSAPSDSPQVMSGEEKRPPREEEAQCVPVLCIDSESTEYSESCRKSLVPCCCNCRSEPSGVHETQG